MSEPVFTLERGTAPLLVSLPHVGTAIPDDLAPRSCRARSRVEDTDWHLAEALRLRARARRERAACRATRAT